MDTADARHHVTHSPDAIARRAEPRRRLTVVRGLPPVRSRPEGLAARRRRRQGRAAPDGAGARHAPAPGVGRPRAATPASSSSRVSSASTTGVVRHDGPPVYDAPPTLDDLFRRGRQEPRTRARVPVRARRTRAIVDATPIAIAGRTLAHEFLGDPTQRAMVHPAPTPQPLLPGHGVGARDVRRRARCRTGRVTLPRRPIGASAPTSAPARNSNLKTPRRRSWRCTRRRRGRRRVGRRARHGGPARPACRRPAADRRR